MSTRQDWRTVPSLFKKLEDDFGPFNLDVAADDQNHLCDRYFTEKQNALLQPWNGVWFCNLPFGKPLPWIQKAISETRTNTASKGGVMLCQAGLSTKWFNMAIGKALTLVPDRRINYWHPDESPWGFHKKTGKRYRRSFDRPSVIFVFGAVFEGRVQSYHVPPHTDEVVALWETANRQEAAHVVG